MSESRVRIDDVDLLTALDQHEPEAGVLSIVDLCRAAAVGQHRVGSAKGGLADRAVEALSLVPCEISLSVKDDPARGGELCKLRTTGPEGLSIRRETVRPSQAVITAALLGVRPDARRH